MKTYLQRLAIDHPIRFGILMTVAALLIKVPFGPLFFLPGGDTTGDVLELGVGIAVFSFFMLPIETFLGQVLPIWILRKFRVTRWLWLILGSSVCFGALHLIGGPGAFFVGFSAGLALSLCWLCWAEVSRWRAFYGTTLVHAAHNCVAFALYFVIPE